MATCPTFSTPISRAGDASGCPRCPKGAHVTVAPDWVCEVLSRRTRTHDRTTKMDAYFAHAVRHVWLVDPKDRSLEVYRRVSDGWLRALAVSGGGKVRAEPFDAIELDLAALWEW